MEPAAWKAYGRYSTVGLELVLSMVLGWAAGRWLDRHFGWHGQAAMVGAILGIYAGFRAIWKAAKAMQREAERQDALEAKRLRGGEAAPERDEGRDARSR